MALAAAEKGKLALEQSAKQADDEIGKARGRAGEIIAQVPLSSTDDTNAIEFSVALIAVVDR